MSTIGEYPNSYASPPTAEERQALELRRAAAQDTPLERGDTLKWRGPSMYDDVFFPLPTMGSSGEANGEDRRLPHEGLLSSAGPARSAHLHSLELVEPLQTGVAWSQVWRCQASGASLSAEQPLCNVVVKFLDEALFPYPKGEIVAKEVDLWDWWSADTLEDREGDAYAALRPLQGAELPFCYGFYNFRLGRGEIITGIVLEDLTEIARPLTDHVRRAKGLYSRDFAAADGLVRSLYGGVRKMHDLEMSEFTFKPRDILVLKASTATTPKLVFLDFGTTRTRAFTEESIKISSEQTRIKMGGFPGARPLNHWRRRDEYRTGHIAREQVSEDMWKWWELKEKRCETLGLWYQSTSRD